MKNISSTLKSIGFIPLSVTIGFLVLVTISYVYGWTEPAGSPPSNNASAPVSVSSTSQYKSGALGIGGVLRGYSDVIGNRLCIGSDCRDAWPGGGSYVSGGLYGKIYGIEGGYGCWTGSSYTPLAPAYCEGNYVRCPSGFTTTLVYPGSGYNIYSCYKN